MQEPDASVEVCLAQHVHSANLRRHTRTNVPALLSGQLPDDAEGDREPVAPDLPGAVVSTSARLGAATGGCGLAGSVASPCGQWSVGFLASAGGLLVSFFGPIGVLPIRERKAPAVSRVGRCSGVLSVMGAGVPSSR